MAGPVGRENFMATIFGLNTTDTITGGIEDDLIFGWDQANVTGDQGPASDGDSLSGGLGNDEAQGGAGNDQVFGGDGNDRLYGRRIF